MIVIWGVFPSGNPTWLAGQGTICVTFPARNLQVEDSRVHVPFLWTLIFCSDEFLFLTPEVV